ncbi:MAG: hypothetical protein Q9N34_01890 [Aquificota bacterium]|nr:hypothetical protein [Aquificota bacterium]
MNLYQRRGMVFWKSSGWLRRNFLRHSDWSRILRSSTNLLSVQITYKAPRVRVSFKEGVESFPRFTRVYEPRFR